jgi:Flp pilus assembly pilin Flp
MDSFVSMVRKFSRDETGASMVEYALLLILVFIACLGGALLLGTSISTFFSQTAASI